MEPFDGSCPKCSDLCEVLCSEWDGDFMVVRFRCEYCKHEFIVFFHTGFIADE